jgi:hypothetical protein
MLRRYAYHCERPVNTNARRLAGPRGRWPTVRGVESLFSAPHSATTCNLPDSAPIEAVWRLLTFGTAPPGRHAHRPLIHVGLRGRRDAGLVARMQSRLAHAPQSWAEYQAGAVRYPERVAMIFRDHERLSHQMFPRRPIRGRCAQQLQRRFASAGRGEISQDFRLRGVGQARRVGIVVCPHPDDPREDRHVFADLRRRRRFKQRLGRRYCGCFLSRLARTASINAGRIETKMIARTTSVKLRFTTSKLPNT